MSHGAVYKSLNIEKLDTFYRNDPAGALESSAALLAEHSTQEAATSFAGDGNILPGELDHFDHGWLDDDAQRVMRIGEMHAIEVAQGFNPPAPIETFWVTGASNDFEMHIHAPAPDDDDARVTVFMFIPTSRGYGSRRAASSSWIVRIGDRDDVHHEAFREVIDEDGPAVYRIQVSGPRPGDDQLTHEVRSSAVPPPAR